MPKMSTEELVKRIRKIKPWEISTGDFDEFTLDQSDAIALLDRERPTPEPAEDARELAEKIVDQMAKHFELLNIDLVFSGETFIERLEKDLEVFRARILDEAAERIEEEWLQLFSDDATGDRKYVTTRLRAAVRGKE